MQGRAGPQQEIAVRLHIDCKPMRRLARLAVRAPGARALAASPGGRRLVRALQVGLLVGGTGRFAWRELRGGGVGLYTPRGAAQQVHVRHGSADLDILYELWRLRLYDPPADAQAALARGPVTRVADLGAHIGLFGAWARDRWPGCEVDAFEPDPGNAAVHRRTIEANQAAAAWRLHEAAAGTGDGEARFAAGKGPASRLDASSGDTIAVRVRDAFAVLGSAQLVKIDIEGAEWELLRDERFASLPARAVVLEFHDAGSEPASDPAASAAELLARAGFRTREIPGAPVGAGMLWAWRP